MATIAAFGVLAGGGAYAASQIGANDIAKNAIRSKHIKAGAVTEAKLADGLEGAPGATGPPGPAGADPPTADLSLEHTASVNGTTITHTFTVTNSGPAVPWAALTMTWTPATEWVTTFPTDPAIVCSGNEEVGAGFVSPVYCILGDVPIGTSTFTIVSGACAGASRSSTGVLSASLGDPSPGDHESTANYSTTNCV